MCKEEQDKLLVGWIPRYLNEETAGMTKPQKLFSTGA
jgi:hypothetical protein